MAKSAPRRKRAARTPVASERTTERRTTSSALSGTGQTSPNLRPTPITKALGIVASRKQDREGAHAPDHPAVAAVLAKLAHPTGRGRRPLPAASRSIDFTDPTVRGRALALLKAELAELRWRVSYEERRSRNLPALARLRVLVQEEMVRYARLAAFPDLGHADWIRDEAAELKTADDALATALRILENRAVAPLGLMRSIEAAFVMRTSSRFDDDLIAEVLFPRVDRRSALERVRQHRSTSHRRIRKANGG